MKQEEIIESVRSSFNKIHKLLEHIIDSFNEEAIHEFRKEIKRVRAFLRLFSIEKAEEDKLKISAMMKTFYSYLGIIRNLQLQKKNITDYCDYEKLSEAYLKVLILI